MPTPTPSTTSNSTVNAADSASIGKPTATADSLLDSDSLSAENTAPAELTAVVDQLLDSLTSKFSTVSAEIFGKMDEMSRRLDNLEETLQEGAEGRK